MTSTLNLAIRDYGFLTPIRTGDVSSPSLKLDLDLDTTAGARINAENLTVEAGELSLARHIGRVAAGDDQIIAIPYFPNRSLKFRAFQTRRGSGVQSLADLRGKKVGITDWPATGNTWERALIREAGVPIDSIAWYLGEIPGAVNIGRPQGTLPPFVTDIRDGTPLDELLVKGELDALLGSPEGRHPEIVRIYQDYRSVERAYYAQTNQFFIHHVIGIRKDVFDSRPDDVVELYSLLERARLHWKASRERVAVCDSTPWHQQDLEETRELVGPDWNPNGVGANSVVLERLLDELVAQGLTSRRVDLNEVFGRYEALAAQAA